MEYQKWINKKIIIIENCDYYLIDIYPLAKPLHQISLSDLYIVMYTVTLNILYFLHLLLKIGGDLFHSVILLI